MDFDEYSVIEDHKVVAEFLGNSYLINLESQPENIPPSREEFAKFGLSFVRFPGVDGKAFLNQLHLYPGDHPNHEYMRAKKINVHSWVGCTRAHRGVLKIAKLRQHPHVCIFEDDVRFSDDFLFLTARALEVLPDDWDALFIGGIVGSGDKEWEIPPGKRVPFNKWLARSQYLDGCHAYVIRDTLYDKLLDAFEPPFAGNSVAWWPSQLEDNWYAFRYWAASQRWSYSTLRGRNRAVPNTRKQWVYADE